MSEAKTFPVLETDRLVMKQLTLDYLEPVFRHYANSETNRFTDSPDAENTGDVEEIIQWGLWVFEIGKGFLWGLFDKQDDTFLGEVNMVFRQCGNTSLHRVEIGYDLVREYWGNGYITEAAGAAIAHIFSLGFINRIEAVIHPGNLRSQKVVERQGFTRETVLREYAVFDGNYQDMVLYSLLKSEWEERRQG
ncbi:MAG: GNAT family N-acetyltransferase [Dehalococcoidales bacterium]|nr:GNAT family N-acetyltransferase [Dehalococcoidales bacterium]